MIIILYKYGCLTCKSEFLISLVEESFDEVLPVLNCPICGSKKSEGFVSEGSEMDIGLRDHLGCLLPNPIYVTRLFTTR